MLDESLSGHRGEADNLNVLIDNLLEVSRFQAGTFALEIGDEMNLAKLAADVARKCSPQSAGFDIAVDFPEGYPTIFGDERRLTQVLNNLVSNAIKYSPTAA